MSLALALIEEGRIHDLHCDGNLKERAVKAALSGAAQLLAGCCQLQLYFWYSTIRSLKSCMASWVSSHRPGLPRGFCSGEIVNVLDHPSSSKSSLAAEWLISVQLGSVGSALARVRVSARHPMEVPHTKPRQL